MDVGATATGTMNVSNLTAGLTAAKSVDTTTAANAANAATTTAGTLTGAFSLDITTVSANVKTGQAANHGEAVKGLTSDQVDILKDGINRAYEVMIKTLTEHNVKMQGWLDSGIGRLNFENVAVDAYKFGLPEVATTPEEAEEAVSEDGDYGVDAVADRIFGMADAIAGGDADRLDKMWGAIQEGFKLAKSFWKDTTGEDEMPDITQKTYDAVKQRIDDRKAEIGALNGTFADVTAQAANASQTANASSNETASDDTAATDEILTSTNGEVAETASVL